MSETVYLEDLVFTGEVHPYADRWPMRSVDELESLAESIRTEGQDLPIILTPDGVLVDGRNRLRACEIANVTPRFEVRGDLTDEDAVSRFVWRMNGDHRRHMSKGALAMLAALRPGTQSLIFRDSGVSAAYVSWARVVIEFCDADIIEAVIRDDKDWPLKRAYEVAQQIKATVQAEQIAARKAAAEEKKRAERDAARLADLRANRPDLAALADDGSLSLDEALALRAQEAEKARRAEQIAQEKRRKLNADFSVHVVTLAGLGEYPDRVDDLIGDWDTSQQITPITSALINTAIRGLTAVARHIEGNA